MIQIQFPYASGNNMYIHNKFSPNRKKKPFDVAARVCVPKSLNVS